MAENRPGIFRAHMSFFSCEVMVGVGRFRRSRSSLTYIAEQKANRKRPTHISLLIIHYCPLVHFSENSVKGQLSNLQILLKSLRCSEDSTKSIIYYKFIVLTKLLISRWNIWIIVPMSSWVTFNKSSLQERVPKWNCVRLSISFEVPMVVASLCRQLHSGLGGGRFCLAMCSNNTCLWLILKYYPSSAVWSENHSFYQKNIKLSTFVILLPAAFNINVHVNVFLKLQEKYMTECCNFHL